MFTKFPFFSSDDLNSIIEDSTLILSDVGENDSHGYQVFTPSFIVNDMIKLIGIDNVINLTNTILEPASGDGGFTYRILEIRLKSILSSKEYQRESLIALSTLYSIELDEELIAKQRNLIYTLFLKYARMLNFMDGDYLLIARNIIYTNFIHGEFNISKKIVNYGDPLGWYVVDGISENRRKKKKHEIKFAVWKISSNLKESTCVLEYFEQEKKIEKEYSYGGVFDVQQ